MRTNIKYKKKVLTIKIIGILVGRKIEEFENEILPIILSLQSKKVVINMENVNLIDKSGINSIIKISNIVNNYNGKVVLCNLNNYLKINLSHSDIFDYCFKSKDEKSTNWVFNS